jgi:predicted ATP-grasp superfamily ATP-dependent carboligase
MEAETARPSIVVPAVGAASSTVCLRSLGRYGVRTIAISERPNPPAFWSRYCDESMVVPSPRTDLDGYTQALLGLARRPDVRAIVPIRELDVYVLATNRETFAEHVTPLWPPADTLRTAHDRIELAAAAREAGVHEPNTRLLGDVEDWDNEQIIKGRFALLAPEYISTLDTGTTGEVGKTTYPSVGAEPDQEKIRREMGHEPVVQEYVDGTEYTFRALYDHGEAVTTAQKRMVRGFKYARGPSVCHETDRDPGLERAGRKLLDAIDWHGLASVGFIREEETGDFYLLEINPRFWASLPLDVHAGLDFPRYYWQIATGEPTTASADYERYEAGKQTHLLRGELSHLYSVLTEDYGYVSRPRFRDAAWDVVTSIATQPYFDYLSADDPGPFVGDLLGAIPYGSHLADLRPKKRSSGLSGPDL